MPNKALENFRVGAERHAGLKLTDEQKDEIRAEYQAGGTSQRKLAAKWGVSRRLITFILDPEKLQANRALRGDKYYDKDKHREYMAVHRERKKALMLRGKEDKG